MRAELTAREGEAKVDEVVVKLVIAGDLDLECNGMD